MLWNVVYEFFVRYIFGGWLYEDGVAYPYRANWGGLLSKSINPVGALDSSTGGVGAGFLGDSSLIYSWGNYLSLIATIISMVAIVLICCRLIKKIYNMCAHIIG